MEMEFLASVDIVVIVDSLLLLHRILYFMTLRQRCTTASATAAKKSSEKLARADFILRQSEKNLCVETSLEKRCFVDIV